MKRKILFLALLLLSILFSSCAPAPVNSSPTALPTLEPSPMPLTKVNACYSATGTTQAVVWYAHENGLFQKYGLDVTLTGMGGGSKAVAALISGDMDICQVAGSAVANGVAAGKDTVLIAGFYDVLAASLYVSPDIKTPDDLKGKTLGASGPGSSIETATILALKKIGLIPGQDVTILNMGDDPERLIALETGQIDGTILVAPSTLAARQKGFVELYNLATAGIPYQNTGVATTRHFLETNRPAAIAFLKACIEAIAKMKSDPEGTKNVMAKYLQLDPVTDSQNIDEAYNVVIKNTLLSVPEPSVPGIQTLIDTIKAGNPDAAALTPDQIADFSLVKELEENGFIANLSK